MVLVEKALSRLFALPRVRLTCYGRLSTKGETNRKRIDKTMDHKRGKDGIWIIISESLQPTFANPWLMNPFASISSSSITSKSLSQRNKDEWGNDQYETRISFGSALKMGREFYGPVLSWTPQRVLWWNTMPKTTIPTNNGSHILDTLLRDICLFGFN